MLALAIRGELILGPSEGVLSSEGGSVVPQAIATDPAASDPRAEQGTAHAAPTGAYLAATILGAIVITLMVAGVAYLRSSRGRRGSDA